MHCKLYIFLHTSQSHPAFTSAVLRLSPRIMQMLAGFLCLAISAWDIHLLKLDIFLTSVRQSWTEVRELPFGYWESNKICHCGCLFDRQMYIYIFYLFFLLMCNVIKSAQSSVCTMRMDWKGAVVKIQLACHCFSDGSAFADSPQYHWWSSALYTVLLNIEHCIRFNEKLLFDLLLFFLM